MKLQTRSVKTTQQELTIIRNFDAAREFVWKAWTVPDLFAQWYGLTNSTLSGVKMDVRVGGGWSAIMHIPNTPEISWKADYSEVAEPKRLVFALRNPDNLEDPNREIVSVIFEKLGDKTRVVFSQAGNLPPEQYNKGLKEGWNAFFDRLDTLVRRMKKHEMD
ncbi:MAG: SRPBCC domain-containing protein [Dehalococcoidales bacterium]